MLLRLINSRFIITIIFRPLAQSRKLNVLLSKVRLKRQKNVNKFSDRVFTGEGDVGAGG